MIEMFINEDIKTKIMFDKCIWDDLYIYFVYTIYKKTKYEGFKEFDKVIYSFDGDICKETGEISSKEKEIPLVYQDEIRRELKKWLKTI